MKVQRSLDALVALVLSLQLVITCAGLAYSQTLVNPGFEAPFAGVAETSPTVISGVAASGWSDNSYGTVNAAYSQSTSNAHSGGSSQQIQVNSIGSSSAVQCVQWLNFQAATTIGTVWLKSNTSMSVTVMLREGASPYTSYGQTTVQVGTAWTQVTVSGTTPAVSGGFFIVPGTPGTSGTLWVDQATLATAVTLTDSGFESPYNSAAYSNPTNNVTITGSVANGWGDNTNWASNINIAYSQDTTTKYSGSSSQKIVCSLGFAQFGTFGVTFAGGQTTATVYLKAASPMMVELSLNEGGAPYQCYGSEIAYVGTSWTPVTVSAYTLPGGGSLLINTGNSSMSGTGTLWVDNASMSYSPIFSVFPPAATVIPGTYFGLHLNGVNQAGPDGQTLAWPTFAVGTTRTLNMGNSVQTCPFWAQIEPNAPVNGVHTYTNLSNLDTFMSDANANGVKVIFTVYQTPAWATTDKTTDSYGVVGGAGNPTTISNYQAFISFINNRYPGEIEAFEPWNEPDQSGTWHGTPAQMAALEQACATTVHGDGGKVISPPLSTLTNFSQVNWFNNFLSAGGCSYSDYIGIHYYSNYPEDYTVQVPSLVALLAAHGISGKQLWTTEGGWGYDGTGGSNPDGLDTQPMSETMGYVGRAFVTEWAVGSPVFAWYLWNTTSNVGQTANSQGAYTVVTPALCAYGKIWGWLVNSTMLSLTADSNDNWVCVVAMPGGVTGYIIWNPNNNSFNYSIPTSWGITQEITLSGATTNMTGVSNVTVGNNPIILEN